MHSWPRCNSEQLEFPASIQPEAQDVQRMQQASKEPIWRRQGDPEPSLSKASDIGEKAVSEPRTPALAVTA